MAVFDYKCKECGEVFEVLTGMTNSDDKDVCPKCGKEASKIPPTTSKPIIK